MVWRKVRQVLVCMTLAAMMAQPFAASAYTVYTDGNISNTYTTVFEDLVGKKSIKDDYLYFRSGQYEYVLLIGDLKYENGTFSGEKAKEYKITTYTGYNSNYTYSVADVVSVNLVPGTALVYSNLGDFPELVDTSENYDFAILLLLMVVVCMSLFREIFRYSQRGQNA